MTTTSATYRNPKLENLAPQDALDMALIIALNHYYKLGPVSVPLKDLYGLSDHWLKLPVDYGGEYWIYNILDQGGTIRKDSGLTDAEIIAQIKDALRAFMDEVDALYNRGTQ